MKISTDTGAIAAEAPFSPLPLLAVLIWTGNTLVTKLAATAVEPAAMAFYRWLLAGAILTPFAARAVWRRRAVVAAHWPKLALLGALGMGMYQGLAYEAARTTSALNMGVIVATMPLMAMLPSCALGHDRLTAARLGGALLSLAGVVVLAARGQPAQLLHGALHPGDVLMLVAVASNAVYGVLLKHWQLPLSTWEQLYVQIGFGVLLLAPFWWAAPSAAIPPQGLPLILYAGTAASIGAPYCWMKGVKRLGPARAAMFMNLLPLLVAVGACGLLGETLHGYHALGGVLALAGVLWSQRRRQ